MLKKYFLESKEHCFWLVTSSVYREAIKANNKLGFDDTRVLFTGNTYSKVMPMTPVLIPVSSDVKNLPDDILNKGIGLVSDVGLDNVLLHLQSLLVAALDGEVIMFRFYDPNVITNMLASFSLDETTRFLGNVNKLIIANDESCTVYESKRKSDFELKKSPWWIIKPEHLENLYNVNNHAYILERYWWEKVPDIMENLSNPKEDIIKLIHESKNQYENDEYLELYCLYWLAQKSNITIDYIYNKLPLIESEKKFIKDLARGNS